MLYDSYKLKGVCLYRMDDPLGSIKNFNLANRYKQMSRVGVPRNREEVMKELEYTYINLFIEETRHLFSDPTF